jgi:hypothetical protein
MEFLMSIKTRIATVAFAMLAATGTLASTTTQAEARGFGWGLGAGLIGAAVVGGAIAANDGYYYDGYAIAAGFASSMPMATTSAAFAPAIIIDGSLT